MLVQIQPVLLLWYITTSFVVLCLSLHDTVHKKKDEYICCCFFCCCCQKCHCFRLFMVLKYFFSFLALLRTFLSPLKGINSLCYLNYFSTCDKHLFPQTILICRCPSCVYWQVLYVCFVPALSVSHWKAGLPSGLISSPQTAESDSFRRPRSDTSEAHRRGCEF